MSFAKGSRTRYGVAFAVFAVALIYNAWHYRGWAWLLLWPALSFAIVAAGYLVLGPRVMGKSAVGDFHWWSHALLLPFCLLLTITVAVVNGDVRVLALWGGVASLVVIPLAMGFDFVSFIPETFAPFVTGAGVLAFCLGWIGLGISAIRLDRPAISLEGAA